MNKGWMVSGLVVVSLAALAAACTVKGQEQETPEFGQDPDPPAKKPQNETVEAGAGSSGSNGGSSGSSGTADKGDAGGDGGETAPACFGETGTLPKCEEGACKFHCDNYTADYKKGIAAEIMKCHAKTQCNQDPNKCTETTLKKACADPTAVAFCAGLVGACNGAGGDELTKTQCEMIVKGLTAVGRGHFKGCVEENVGNGQCKYGSAECYYRFQ